MRDGPLAPASVSCMQLGTPIITYINIYTIIIKTFYTAIGTKLTVQMQLC